MAVAAIMVVGCKNIGSKKAAQEAAAAEAAAEEAAAEQAERINKAIEEVEASENMTALEAVEALSCTQIVEGETIIDELAAIPFAAVEEKPSFNGGDANDFSKWVAENIVYPQDAQDRQVSGRVILQFTVTKEGDVKDVKVLKGIDPSLDAEAVRVVSASPKWAPGNQNNIPVAVNYIFPVIFKLN